MFIFILIYRFEPGLYHFPDVQHLKYATDPLEKHTIVIVEMSTFE